ncbi:23481_t:CDS:2, partial [Racocetra persica]
ELNAILTTVSGIETKKKELEKDKSAEIRLREIEEDLVKVDESIHRVTVEMREYNDATKGRAAYAKFKALEDGSIMYTIESLGAQMIGQEIVFQLAKIDDTDFNSKIAATGSPFAADTTKQGVENGKAVGPEGSGGIGRRYEKNGVEIITHEYNTKVPTLKYEDLFNFVHLLAPITDMKGIDAPFFTKLDNKKKLVKEGNAPQEFLNSKFAYFDDPNKGKVINLKDGLEGWIKLYYMIFQNKSNREKVIRSVNGDGTVGTSIENILITNYHDSTFKNDCSYESELEDKEGNKIRVFAVSDPNEVASILGLRKRALETKKKLLEKNELKDQGQIDHDHKKKIDDEQRKLEVEEGKIDALVKDEIAAKQKKVTDMNLTGLKNEGKDGRPFKQSTNQTILDLIDSKRKDFENLGTDLASRITAAKADTEIGLELFRDAYEELGDQTVVNAINAELAKDKPQQSANESDIKTIFFDVYSPTVADKTKYNALLKYLKENGDDEGKKEYDDSDDTKKAE